MIVVVMIREVSIVVEIVEVISMDRAINPFDGSRRRLKSEKHKSPKDYNRQKNKKVDINETFLEEDLLLRDNEQVNKKE